MVNIKNISSSFLFALSSAAFCMEEPQQMIHMQKAEDLGQFAGQVVAYTPVKYIEDYSTYKFPNSGLRYAIVSLGKTVEWRHWESLGMSGGAIYEGDGREHGHALDLLVTIDVLTSTTLVTRLLKGQQLFMRRVTLPEIAALRKVIASREAHFELQLSRVDEGLKLLDQMAQITQRAKP